MQTASVTTLLVIFTQQTKHAYNQPYRNNFLVWATGHPRHTLLSTSAKSSEFWVLTTDRAVVKPRCAPARAYEIDGVQDFLSLFLFYDDLIIISIATFSHSSAFLHVW